VERRKERPKRDHANRRAVRSEDSGRGSNQGEHTLYLIVEVDDESQVLAFLAPFESGKQRGHLPSLDVRRGSRQRQLRGADAGSVNLCQLWIPHGRHANVRFYLRNHFHIPNLGPESYQLTVGGERPLSLSLRELAACDQTLVGGHPFISPENAEIRGGQRKVSGR
jgi:hypothetical protein